MNLNIDTPPWAAPLLVPSRYKGVFGGRGSGKSHERAEALVEAHLMKPDLSSVCLREVQKSIKMSVKRLLEQKIQKFNLQNYFDVQDQIIKRKNGSGVILFQGMQNHTADSIKSLEGFDISWFEEAQAASNRSITLLRPTIRKPGSELWFSWNPEFPTDPVDQLLRGDQPPPDSIAIEVNYYDNPWFPDVLKDEMEYDKSRDREKYEHVWCGKYNTKSNRIVFRNWKIEEFETPPDATLRFGADWGFSVDPTVLVRCFIEGRNLYIDYEAYMVGCEIVDTPDLFMTVPESELWPIVADSSRPETISHLRKNGFPKIMKAIKGSRSLEEGIEFLQSYNIIVHPRCKNVIKELKSYSYRKDPLTDEVLSVLEDKDNHTIDALRYACEGVRRIGKKEKLKANPIPTVNRW